MQIALAIRGGAMAPRLHQEMQGGSVAATQQKILVSNQTDKRTETGRTRQISRRMVI